MTKPAQKSRNSMNKSTGISLILLAFTACAASIHADTIVYTETFDNSTGSDRPFSDAGVNWSVHYGSSATSYALTSNDANVDPVISSAPSSSGSTPGYLFQLHTLNPSAAHIWWTDEADFGDISLLKSISFDLRNESSSENLRVALQVGSDWFVSESVFNNSSPDVWTQDLSLDVGSATYTALTFTPGADLSRGSVTSLPSSGTVNAVGLFDENKSENRIRIDNFRVTVIPEPSTLLLVSITLGVCSLLRRR